MLNYNRLEVADHHDYIFSFDSAARNNSIDVMLNDSRRVFSQDILPRPMILFPSIFLCIMSCWSWYLSFQDMWQKTPVSLFELWTVVTFRCSFLPAHLHLIDPGNFQEASVDHFKRFLVLSFVKVQLSEQSSVSFWVLIVETDMKPLRTFSIV